MQQPDTAATNNISQLSKIQTVKSRDESYTSFDLFKSGSHSFMSQVIIYLFLNSCYFTRYLPQVYFTYSNSSLFEKMLPFVGCFFFASTVFQLIVSSATFE